MDKQKQIEGMYDDISEQLIGVLGCEKMSLAIYLHNAGYRKIPENAVVILEEEMEQFAETFAKSPQMQKVMYGLIKTWKKETAEKFKKVLESKLYPLVKGWDYFWYNQYEVHNAIRETCKEIIGEEK